MKSIHHHRRAKDQHIHQNIKHNRKDHADQSADPRFFTAEGFLIFPYEEKNETDEGEEETEHCPAETAIIHGSRRLIGNLLLIRGLILLILILLINGLLVRRLLIRCLGRRLGRGLGSGVNRLRGCFLRRRLGRFFLRNGFLSRTAFRAKSHVIR